MACENVIGVKNVLIWFEDCSTGQRVGPVSHDLAGDDLPNWRTCSFVNENLPGGYIKRTHSNMSADLNVIRDTRLPLSWYQGCASVDLQVEYENGIVYTGAGGGVMSEDRSDSHEVALEISFRTLDEMLPDGALA